MRKGFVAFVLALLPAASFAFAEPPNSNIPPASSSPTVLGAIGIIAPASGSDGLAGGCCDDFCAPREEPCGPPGRFWVSAEYLLWWIKDSHLPPLVTANATAPLATLATPGTVTLFGGNELNHQEFSGGRFQAGFWLNDCHTIGLEADYFFLNPRAARFSVGNTGAPALSRPFFDAFTGMQSAEAVSSPGIVTGRVRASDSSNLWSPEANAVANVCCGCCYRVDVLAGFRYLSLGEGLNVREDLVVAPNVPGLGGSTFNLTDQFDTENHFYGGQIGTRVEYRAGKAYVDLLAKVALGSTQEVVRVNGATLITAPGAVPVLVPGGLLAQGSNSGRRSRDEFSVVPEVGINVGYQVTDHLRAYVGYTFLYWSNVVRPEDQIDLRINPTQVPSLVGGAGTLIGPALPAPLFRDTNFWAQGINLGMEFRY